MKTRTTVSRRLLVACSAASGALAALGGERILPSRAAHAGPPEAADTRVVPAHASECDVPLHGVSKNWFRADQITEIKVCLRPFRAMGPRLDVERIGDKTVFHHYGHGGSGWSLSWGSANRVVNSVTLAQPRKVAVIGCGIIGLTSALTAQRAGFDVTIYTRDLLPQTRSVRANGSWTPDSRIALTGPAGAGFGDMWEDMARHSWTTYRSYLGLPGNPIAFVDNYHLSDVPFGSTKEAGRTDAPSLSPVPQRSEDFAVYSHRITDIVPAAEDVTASANPFPVAWARRRPLMIYNFAAYGHLLLSEFFQAGGKIVMREFHSPAEIKSLREDVVINCPGYAARDWWKDDSLIPVRGQTAWLAPRPSMSFGVAYRGAAVLPKGDGLMIQGYDLDGLGEMSGVGNAFEHPDREEARRAIDVMADLFSRQPEARG